MNEDQQTVADGEKPDSIGILISHLSQLFDVYKDQMQAIRDIIAATTPHASALDEPAVRFEQMDQILSDTSKENATAVRELIHKVAQREITSSHFMRTLMERFEGQLWVYKFIVAFHEMAWRQPRLPMLRNSLLTTAVASFEAVIANVATEFYHYRPEALDMHSKDREKEFSLKELKQFRNIDDAVEFLISKRVENLMFGGISDWRRFFNEAIKINFADLAINWSNVQEIMQRRHVIMHNGGRASRRYINQTRLLDIQADTKEGESLDSDQEYLEHAIDELLVIGVLLIVSVAVKFSRSDEERLVGLSTLAYTLLREGRLDATACLCTYGMGMPIDEEEILIFKVNKMLALKAAQGTEEIRGDIEPWDVSALSDKFKLAKACLLDNLDEAFRLLPGLVESGVITTENLLEWPLLQNMSSDERFAVVIASKIEEAVAEGEAEDRDGHNRVSNEPNDPLSSAD